MRKIVAVAAIVLTFYLIWPSADCSGKTEAECERIELINAGAID
jgi:hypothetical protein